MIELKEPFGFIYITTNMINGVRYIGQRRFSRGYETYLGSGKILKKAIKKYGKENFIRSIVAIAYSKEELDKLEIEFIKNYNAVDSDDFYNISDGGHTGNNFAGKSEEEMIKIRQKMSKNQKGKVVSSKTKKYISDALKGKYIGKKHWFHNKHFSELHKKRISKSNMGKIVSNQAKENMKRNHANVKRENHPHAKKIICLNTNKIFDCIQDAVDVYNCLDISGCCNGKLKSCGVYNNERLAWAYYKDYLKMTQQDIENKIKEANLYKKGKNNPKAKKVICITTMKIFGTMTEAEEFYHCNRNSIRACCNNMGSYAGKLKDGTKLVWLYYDEYIKQNQLLIHNENLGQAI